MNCTSISLILPKSESLDFQDISVRKGKCVVFKNEFAPQFVPQNEDLFPIFAWIPPNYSRKYKEKADLFDSDKMHAEYAMCNFTLGASGFGVRQLLRSNLCGKPAKLAAAVAKPDVWGMMGKDEPRANAFQKCLANKLIFQKYAGNKPFFNNLLPAYGFRRGTQREDLEKFRSYIAGYIDTVKPKVFTFDYYPLGRSGYSEKFFANLEIVRDESLKKDCDFGLMAQLVGFAKARSASEAELRWQAFSSLAYGAKIMGWFTFLTEYQPGFNWHDAVIDLDGVRTRHYAMLRRLNAEIILLGHTLLKLRSEALYHSKPLPVGTKDIAESKLLSVQGNGKWILGEFKRTENGSIYFMLVNRDFDSPAVADITFKMPVGELTEVSKKDGELRPVSGFDVKSNRFKAKFNPGDGRLFRIRGD